MIDCIFNGWMSHMTFVTQIFFLFFKWQQSLKCGVHSKKPFLCNYKKTNHVFLCGL